MTSGKVCAACQEEKLLDYFAPFKRGSFGRYSYCRACVSLRNKAFYAANKDREKKRSLRHKKENPEQTRETLEKWRAANVERERRYRQEHAEVIGKRNSTWRAQNKPRLRAGYAARRARILEATPAWASASAIADMYALAERVAHETGIPHEVDHIIPLRSKIVCGLHCESNLQVIPRATNRTKSNRFHQEFVSALGVQ